jgi:phage terminase small subunit
MEVLGQLSPVAVAHWPTLAKQLPQAGVLGSVDARSVARYCEAFAQWCAAGARGRRGAAAPGPHRRPLACVMARIGAALAILVAPP